MADELKPPDFVWEWNTACGCFTQTEESKRLVNEWLHRHAPVSPSAPAVASEVDVARQLRHSLNDIKFKDTTVRGAPTSQGYEFVEIPVWQIRQWIDRLSRAPAPQEDVEHHSEPSTKGEVK